MSLSLVDVEFLTYPPHTRPNNSCVRLYIYGWSDSAWPDKPKKLSLGETLKDSDTILK